VDDAKLVQLKGNTYPMARKQFDEGLIDSNQLLQRMILVLKRSPEQEKALAAFNQRQYDSRSPDFHHWLHAEEFGRLYGPADADITAITNWLQNRGFQIGGIGKGRVWIEFTGTVAQVQTAFHVEIHRYLVEGKQHISNDRDPQIPAALAPVIEGVTSLNDFRPKHYSHFGNYVKRDLKTGKYTELEPQISSSPKGNLTSGSLVGKGSTGTGVVQPDLGYIDASTGYVRQMLAPYDVATIYNILPLWKESTPINGKGVKVAIVALSDVVASDFNTFRKSFALPAGTLTTVHNGPDPGLTDSQGENTEDVEMVSATAPGAQVVLVASKDTQTSDGLILGITYITDNEIAPILTMSYGQCELGLGTSGNTLYNNTFQQAATAGISSFVAAGDSGSSVCTGQNGTPPFADTVGLQVSGMASTPFVTAVGGTDLAWPFSTKPYTTWWNSSNNATTGASAKGYMPETVWNATCTNPLLLTVYTDFSNNEDLCNAAISQDPGLVVLAAGSGGVSHCTKPTGNTPASCAGGYAKPSWQTGSGVPADGKRDIPDVSMFASYGFQQSTGIPGSALLICQATNSPQTSCNYSNPNFIIYQENGGTSAASPLTAGIMALVLQKTGSEQGLPNPVLYQLAATENYANCNSNTVANGSSCIFYDVTQGTNAQVCVTGDPNCVTNTSGDQAGIVSGYPAKAKYDVATGLGTMNVANLVNAWPTTSTAPVITLTPATLAFAATNVGTTTAAKVVTVKNTGNTAATLTSETIGGTNAGSFLKSATTCGASLAAGASCTVSVEFKPAKAGALTGSLNVADNAAGSPQSVALSGTGTAAATVTLTPSTLTFDTTDVGSTSPAQAVTLTNGGTTALTITSVTLSGTNPAAFTDLSTCGASLAAKASCQILVAFRPGAAGNLTATLSVADSATGSPQKVTLSGTGAAKPTVTLTPAKLTFASTKVGAASPAQAVTLKNTGASTLGITSIAVTGTNATSFLQLNTCGTTLAGGTSCTILVDFKPTVTGALTASLVVTDNGTGSPHKVALTGTGAAQ
jgi:subtilase family serine protease